MIDDSLTIIVPTIGRPSLKATLDSIAMQIGMYDQVFVVADGQYPDAKKLVESYGIQYGYFDFPSGPTGDWGARARNFAIPIAKKAYIAFMDDDDCYLPGAFAHIRAAIQSLPGQPFIFRMIHGTSILWTREEIAIGNVSSQMVVVPNDQEKLGRFSERYEGDFDFIQSTAGLYACGYDPFIWRKEIIAILFKANGKSDASALRAVELPADKRDLHSD
jgi:glycosyltransferase involved in cell wall biosynthesis